MLYTAYQASEDLLAPAQAWAGAMAHGIRLLPPAFRNPWTRHVEAVAQLTALNRVRHERPAWDIDAVQVGAERVPVHEEVVDATPFASLRHFVKERGAPGPTLLVVAPMSGHFATLLRATVRTALVDHDVYVTDWHNVRDVPLDAGEFGIDTMVEHVVRFAGELGPGNHILSVCQSAPLTLAAVAVMAEAGDPAVPRSLTLMAGPVDPRISPTAVNQLSLGRTIEWFERNVITTVPARYRGAGRRVYPGFLQLTAFLHMNLGNHVQHQLDAYVDMVGGDDTRLVQVRAFYEEYFSVVDLAAPFYLETVQRVFKDAELPRGNFSYQGRTVDLGAITATGILTVEGGHDDICGPGQTRAALDLCTNVAEVAKGHLREPGVGHYGVFSGHRWHNDIYPVLRDFVAAQGSLTTRRRRTAA